MKLLRCAFCVLFVALGHVFAQQDVEEEVDNFTPTIDDDMILYTKKFDFKIGFRTISGATASFTGSGSITSTQKIGDDDDLSEVRARYYHDGSVYVDTRTATDPSGRSNYIVADGKTNTWSFVSDDQAVINGIIQMHTYAAEISNFSREKDPKGDFGVDLSIERDMGKVFNTKLKWGLVGGTSINAIAALAKAKEAAQVTTVTDYYSTFGQAAPDADYTAPTYTNSVDTSVLISQTPLDRVRSTTTNTTDVTVTTRLKGAYMTFRVGPSLFVPFTEHFSASFAAGFALAYVGTTFEMTEAFLPATGDLIVNVIHDGESRLLPGVFVDANIQYAMNDNASLYLGSVYQNNGSFDQKISETAVEGAESYYTAHVDLSKLQGIRAGVSFKF